VKNKIFVLILVFTVSFFILASPILAARNSCDKPLAPISNFLRPAKYNFQPHSKTFNTPTLLDTINLITINNNNYCYGLTYDWERDVLWINQWESSYLWVYSIKKESPCVKVDSFQLNSGIPSYHLGMGYGGGDTIYMSGYDSNIYKIDMTNGNGIVYRTLPWSSSEGLGFNIVDDVLYCSDWTADECGWSQPSQSGSWNTWIQPEITGLSGAFKETASPQWLFSVNKNLSQAQFYQYSLSAGIPNTTPDSIWDCDPGQTHHSTADIAFDGQYIYILDRSSPAKIWVYDIGLPPPSDTIIWDFETGLQGWTHSNGLPFPGGWDVEPSGYHSAYSPPNCGDSAMWIDSDSLGYATSDTAYSPLIIPDSATTNWLWWGLGFNQMSNDLVEVGIKYYNGTSWNTVPLRTYNQDTVLADSLDISAYNSYLLLQVYFYYHAPGWDWYAGFDNVTINGTFPTLNDVGTKSIDAPPLNIEPNATLNPKATFENYSVFEKTFDVYFTIDTNSANFYADIKNITVPSTSETTVVFDSCHFGDIIGFTYDITVYSNLVDDNNRHNDTLRQQSIINPTFWEILDPPQMPIPSSGHSMATSHNGLIYLFGIHSPGVYEDTFLIYDIENNMWLDGGNAITPSAYGTANYCNGKFYKIGGTNSWPTPLKSVDIFDPSTGNWTSGTNAPIGLLDHITGVFNDSLIFTFGNGNWSITPTNDVYIYDTYRDTWTSATNFPGTARGCAAGGIIDTFAIIACGYLSDGSYGNDYLVGIIDSDNPSNITWGEWSTIPGMSGRYRIPSGVDNISLPQNGRELYVINGQDGPFLDTWSYDPRTDTWTDWNQPKPHPVGSVTPVVVTKINMEDVGVFISGGYSGNYISNNELFHTGKTPPTGVKLKVVKKHQIEFGFEPDNPTLVRNYASIKYSTSHKGRVNLKIYDASGRLIKTLIDKRNEPPGTKIVYWNGKGKNGKDVASGIYFFILTSGSNKATQKIIILK
jgi:N-acetylneuraminic acid mutarotase